MDPQKGYALMGLSNVVTPVAFDARGERVLTGSYDGKARIWEVATGRLLRTLNPGKRTSGMGGIFLPDQQHVITAADNRIQIWAVSTGRLVTEATGRGSDNALDVSRDGRRMFAGSTEEHSSSPGSGHSTLEVWDIEQSPRRILDLPQREPFIWLESSPNGRTVACAGLDRCVHRWETFPWREEEYAEARSQKSEVGGQKTEDGLSAEARRAKAEGQKSGMGSRTELVDLYWHEDYVPPAKRPGLE
jgi:WD40 repeat protein